MLGPGVPDTTNVIKTKSHQVCKVITIFQMNRSWDILRPLSVRHFGIHERRNSLSNAEDYTPQNSATVSVQGFTSRLQQERVLAGYEAL